MRINELLTEQKQLDEGPLGSLGKVAGKAVGGVAKGIGAVAGGIAGIPGAVKKGFQAGKKTVAGDDDAAQPAAGGATAQPASGATAAPAAGSQPASGNTGGGVVQQFKKGFAQGRGAAPADQATTPAGGQPAPAAGAAAPSSTPAAGAAAEPAQQPAAEPAAAPAPAGAQQKPAAPGAEPAGGKAATPYKAAQDAVSKLDKRGKQNLLKLLQKEFPQAAPAAKPAAAPAAKPGASPAAGGTGFGFNPDTGEPFASKADADAYKASPAAKAPSPGLEPAAAPATEPAAATEPAPKKKGGRKKAAAPSQAEIDADRERIMGPTSDSKINTGNPLAEALAKRIEQHKRKMFENDLRSGQTRIFVK